MRIALGIEYEGTRFHGWQRQEKPELLTLQDELEQALSTIAAQPITAICAGRTDKGVHATGQVVHFDTTAQRPEHAWLLGTNTYLPPEINVRWVKAVSEDFHARFSATARRYFYIIYNSSIRSSTLRNKVTWYYHSLDIAAMQTAGQYLLGEHDFSAYRSVDCQSPTAMRHVDHLNVYRRGDLVIVDIQANAFLHHMVRNIVGVLLEIGIGKQEPIWAKEILEARDRTQASITASAAGLYLVKVNYPAGWEIPFDYFYPLALDPLAF